MSLEQAKRNSNETLDELTRNVISTAHIGKATLETLEKQNEDISTIEDSIESQEYIYEKSMRVLRGMTWTGMIYNAFHKDQKHENTIDDRKRNPKNSSINKTIADKYNNKSEILLADSSNNSNDDDLKEILKTVNEIHDISLLMNETLSHQNNTLERISDKTDVVSDMSLAATLKTSQIIRRSSYSSCTLIGRFLFQDIKTMNYLSVLHDKLIFSDNISLNSHFNCYIKEDNLIGIQNYKTLKYIGTTMFGSIRVSGEYMGKQEECFVRLSGAPSGIFILSKNWGNGGWLKYPIGHNGYINEVTTSVLDKNNRIEVKAIPVAINDNNENNS